jgi:uncharacterized membrane protein YbhN (UPF0104 family)
LSRESEVEPLASELDRPAQVTSGERHLRTTERVVLASGIVLFFFLVARLGADNILANLRMVGWGILLIIGAEILAFLANTLGWRLAFPRQGAVPSFRHLLLARIAGDGVNYLTPTATMGGEFVRVRMLQGQASTPSLAASVIVAKLTQTVGLVIYISGGLFIVLDKLRLPIGAKLGIIGSLALLAIILLALVFVQRRGLLMPALRFSERCLLRFQLLFALPPSELTPDVEDSSGSFDALFSRRWPLLGFACGGYDSLVLRHTNKLQPALPSTRSGRD